MAIASILTSRAQTPPTPTTTPSVSGTPRLGPPQAIYSPYPEYDTDWNKRGLQGKCIVRFTIDPTTGITTGVKIEKSSGSKELDGAALAACSTWRFNLGVILNSQFLLSSVLVRALLLLPPLPHILPSLLLLNPLPLRLTISST